MSFDQVKHFRPTFEDALQKYTIEMNDYSTCEILTSKPHKLRHIVCKGGVDCDCDITSNVW